jgi:hypothetical protein
MTKLIRWEENPDEIVLEEVKLFHLESMNERTLWIGVYTEDDKIYHLNISADGDKLKYYWSDETPDELAQGSTRTDLDAL